MGDAQLEYKLILDDLILRKQKEKNPKVIELLEKSIEEIKKYLNYTPKEMSVEEKNKLKQQREIELAKKTDAINKFFESKLFRGYKFSCFPIFNINQKKLKTVTLKFIRNTTFQLSNSFENANIIQLKQKRTQDGTTIYIEPLSENYVFISKNDILTKAITLIHELGHARVNNTRKSEVTSRDFNEVYPKFLELLFSDYLIENGLEKHGHNVKVKLLKEIKNHMREIKQYEEDGQMFLAPYNYNAIKNNILALDLYIKYKENPNYILSKIDEFIDGLGKMNEEELLNIFELDNSIFSDINISENFKNILETERENIRQK